MDIFERFVLTTKEDEIVKHMKFIQLLDFIKLKASGLSKNGHYLACCLGFDNFENTWEVECDCDCDCGGSDMCEDCDVMIECICYDNPLHSEVFEYIIETQKRTGKIFFTDKEIKLIEKDIYN